MCFSLSLYHQSTVTGNKIASLKGNKSITLPGPEGSRETEFE